MKRISTATAVPNKFGAGKSGFTDGDVVGGVAATDLEGALFDSWQEEIANVIESTGVGLNPADSTQLLTAIKKIAVGRFTGAQQIVASGLYTPTAGTRLARFRGVAPGGGSGGTLATAAGQSTVSGAGSAGNPFEFWVVSGLAPMAITMGAAGIAGTNAPGNGGNGGNIVIGAIATIIGGPGGAAGNATGTFPKIGGACFRAAASTIASAGAMVLAGIVNGIGQIGIRGIALGTSELMYSTGGNSAWGSGGTVDSAVAGGYGAGAGGAGLGQSSASSAGFAGAPGLLLIEEYT